ncbi:MULTISPECIES: glycosyltransferase [unclassified Clostridium]|uniref:glycosyltransferase n=1 Tax=unclassified Clostridium TaxID=2614128 RepID=UPI000297919C|nr:MULTISPECIES: glycosyltransferase [unclassified Clostridium]EKQ51106.1 MAG: glycosyl transferase [Clostridium sp. Maddingley MBC34-26]
MKTLNPKISVIMPVYNGEKFLKQSIESILKQSYKDFEFIVIDDGSTDESLSIIQYYMNVDKRITLISRENRGLVYSLNEGISLAKAEYIARMDSDDISLANRLEKQVKFLDKNGDVDILAGNVDLFGTIDEEYMRTYKEMFKGFSDKDRNETDLFDGYTICHPSVMIRTKVLKSLNGYNSEYKYSEDIELWFRAIKKGFKILKLDDILLKYRLHDNSKSYIERSFAAQDTFKVRVEYIKEFFESRRLNYLIWGAGDGGKNVNNILKSKFSNSNFVGWVDKFKKGNFLGKKVYSPKEILELDFDYIFIATSPGKYYAKEYLQQNKFINIKEFMICYW